MKKKILPHIVILLLGVFILVPEVNAASKTATYSGGFTTAWEKSVNTNDGAGVLTYGYNTFAINEDYAHGYHATKNHFVALSNGRGSFSSPSKGAGKVARVDVYHSAASTMSYSIFY